MLFGAVVDRDRSSARSRIGSCSYTRLPTGVATALCRSSIILGIARRADRALRLPRRRSKFETLARDASGRVEGARSTASAISASASSWNGSSQTISTPGGGSLSGFGRTLLSIGSGIADLLVVIFAGIYPRDAAATSTAPARSSSCRRAGARLPPRRCSNRSARCGCGSRARLIAMVVVGAADRHRPVGARHAVGVRARAARRLARVHSRSPGRSSPRFRRSCLRWPSARSSRLWVIAALLRRPAVRGLSV